MVMYACYIVYNEEDKIAISLNSIISSVDKVIIVDGSWVDFNSISPQSTDKTKVIAETICGNKLIWIDCKKENNKYIPWKNQVEKRNAYMEIIPDDSWFIILDADVMITGKLKERFNKLEFKGSYNGNEVVAVKMINFYPILSENVRAIPPTYLYPLWEIEDIERSGLTDWFVEDLDKQNPFIISPINWIGYYGPNVCIWKKKHNMKYTNTHDNITWDGMPEYISWSIVPNILSVNLKFLNTFQRHYEMARHKYIERNKINEH